MTLNIYLKKTHCSESFELSGNPSGVESAVKSRKYKAENGRNVSLSIIYIYVYIHVY